MKKVLSFVIAAALILSLTVAFASPSKSVINLIDIIDIKDSDGNEIEDFAIIVTEDSAATIAEFDKMAAYYDENGYGRLAVPVTYLTGKHQYRCKGYPQTED